MVCYCTRHVILVIIGIYDLTCMTSKFGHELRGQMGVKRSVGSKGMRFVVINNSKDHFIMDGIKNIQRGGGWFRHFAPFSPKVQDPLNVLHRLCTPLK